MTNYWKIFLLTFVLVLSLSFQVPAKAVVQTESFPDAANFDQSVGSEIATDVAGIQFVSVIPHGNSPSDLLAIDGTGKGAIISKERDTFRTFKGIDFTAVPQAQIIGDVTDDNLPDIISLLPAEKTDTKEWHYAKITAVTSDSFAINVPLRKNILAQSTIIAANGNQYIVQKNNGPQSGSLNESPYNSIFLSRSVDSAAPLPNYATFLPVNSYIAYLLPVKKATSTPRILVHKNTGDKSFLATACQPYIPKNIDTITALATQDVNNDNKKDLILITHSRELMNSGDVSKSYNAEQKVFTLTIRVPPEQIARRNLTSSFFSFAKYPEQLFRIRSNTENQIIVDIVLPTSGQGRDEIESSITAGDTFWLTLNDEASQKNLVYLGDTTGCFTYTGEIDGTVFENSFGQVTLPGAESISDTARTVITDTTNNFLPVNSFAQRKIKLNENEYTIEQNDRGHIFLSPNVGDIRSNVPDLLHSNVAIQYTILPTDPEITVNLANADQIVNVYRDIPIGISRLVDQIPLGTNDSLVRPVDIDDDTDIDLVFIHQNHLFLKQNNER